jgi:hypothetical protein
MAAARAEFKRILIGLHHSAPTQSMWFAAEVASLLRLELLGLFVEEESLTDLAALPFAREFRPLDGWRRIETLQLSQELELVAQGARRLFSEAVRGLSTACQFEVVRGSMAETIASLSRGGDIVVFTEPVSPADRATEQLASWVDAAFRSASAVMLVPKRVARQSGAVVALASAQDDPCIAVAKVIAACAREDLIVLEAFAAAQAASAEASDDSGVTVVRMPAAAARLSDAAGISSALRPLHERLVVITRGAFPDPVASMVASIRHDPVLIVAADVDRQTGSHRRPP